MTQNLCTLRSTTCSHYSRNCRACLTGNGEITIALLAHSVDAAVRRSREEGVRGVAYSGVQSTATVRIWSVSPISTTANQIGRRGRASSTSPLARNFESVVFPP